MLQRQQSLLFLAAAITLVIALFSPLVSLQPDIENESQETKDMDVKVMIYASGADLSMNYVRSYHGNEGMYEKNMVDWNKELDEMIEIKGLSPVFTIGTIGGFVLIAAILALIFFYKRRKLQIRLGIALGVIALLCTVAIFIASRTGLNILVALEKVSSRTTDFEWIIGYHYGFFLFPLVAILLIIGVILVRRDDNLVKSLDRLR